MFFYASRGFISIPVGNAVDIYKTSKNNFDCRLGKAAESEVSNVESKKNVSLPGDAGSDAVHQPVELNAKFAAGVAQTA